MISTRRGLEGLIALVVLLGVLLVVDLRRDRPTADRSLAQGLAIDSVTALGWTRPGAPAIQLVRDRERWMWIEPVEAIAEPAAVANVLATLRAARWHRREPASAAGATRTVLKISTAMPTTGGKPPEYADLPRRTLAIGAPLPGMEQAWIVDGEHALLVDAWIARALDPAPVTLMLRRPLETVGQAAWVELTDARGVIRLEGTPRRLAKPYVALVRPELVGRLEDRLAALELVALPPSPSPPPPAPDQVLKIETPAGTVTVGGACGGDGLVKLTSPGATGCVAPEAAAAVSEALAALHAGRRDVMDPRPAPLDAASVTLRDRSILDVAKLRIGEHAADPMRVAELLAMLSAPAELTELPATAKASATLTVADQRGATIAIELYPGGLVRRPGELLAMKLTPSAIAVLDRTAAAFRDLVPWVEDPLAVLEIRIDDRRAARGAVIGEWTRSVKSAPLPTTPDQARALDALAAQLAAPRPIAPGPKAFAAVHRVAIVVAPPSGPSIVHELEVGRPIAAGCPVRASGMSLLLPTAVCDGVGSLAR